ncbi:MAG: hypothetical protein U0168_02910 [Nannocystaceae bacterium]
MRSSRGCAWAFALCGCGAGVGVGGDDDGGASSSSSSSSGGTSDGSASATTLATTSASATSVDPTAGTADGSGGSSSEATGEPGSTTGEPFPDPVPDDCITEVDAGHHEFTCDGLVFDVEVPEQCLHQACGLVIDVHGLSMSAQMENASTNMRALGQRHGYIVVQPNADPAPPLSNWIPAVDDLKVWEFTERTAAAFHVDPDRWHFTGFSQGGFMTWRFACAHADQLASVAAASACGNDFPIEDCQFTDDESPSEPIDILYVHGTADLVVNFACAQPRRDAVIAHFGLPSEPEVLLDDPDLRWHRFASDEVVFEYLEHDYVGDAPIAGGHCMIGADDPGDAPGQVVPASCDDPGLVIWGEAAMQFFIDHPRG